MNDDTFNELVNRVLSIVPVSLEPAMTLSKPSLNGLQSHVLIEGAKDSMHMSNIFKMF